MDGPALCGFTRDLTIFPLETPVLTSGHASSRLGEYKIRFKLAKTVRSPVDPLLRNAHHLVNGSCDVEHHSLCHLRRRRHCRTHENHRSLVTTRRPQPVLLSHIAIRSAKGYQFRSEDCKTGGCVVEDGEVTRFVFLLTVVYDDRCWVFCSMALTGRFVEGDRRRSMCLTSNIKSNTSC